MTLERPFMFPQVCFHWIGLQVIARNLSLRSARARSARVGNSGPKAREGSIWHVDREPVTTKGTRREFMRITKAAKKLIRSAMTVGRIMKEALGYVE